MLDSLLAIAGVQARIEVDAGRLRPSEIPTATGDAAAARRLLDWTPRIAWETTLADVAGRLARQGLDGDGLILAIRSSTVILGAVVVACAAWAVLSAWQAVATAGAGALLALGWWLVPPWWCCNWCSC